MVTYTLKKFNTGQITLPKRWRDKFDTTNFIGKETKEGLLIKPILETKKEVVYYENDDEAGLIFPKGYDPQKIIDTIQKMDG